MRARVILWIVFALFVFASCTLDTSGIDATYMWMDGPLESPVLLGENVALTLHTNADFGEVTFYYNPIYESSVPIGTRPLEQINTDIYEAWINWLPPGPGEYNVRACTADRCSNNARYIKVNPLPILYATPTAGPTTAGFTPVPVGEVNLWADTTTLVSGTCTYLRWNSVYIDQTFLNGESVALMGSKQVCPAVNTTYSLVGNYSGGSVEKSVMINVQAVPATPTHTPSPDNLGPELTNISESFDQVYDGPQCGVTANTISVRASDPSGIGSVTLWFRAKKTTPAQTGAWRSITMTSTGSGNYQGTLGIPELTSSLGLYADGIVEYYIIATDSKGNSTQSPTSTFDTVMCFG